MGVINPKGCWLILLIAHLHTRWKPTLLSLHVPLLLISNEKVSACSSGLGVCNCRCWIVSVKLFDIDSRILPTTCCIPGRMWKVTQIMPMSGVLKISHATSNDALHYPQEAGILSHGLCHVWVDSIRVVSRKSKMDASVVIVSIVGLYLHITAHMTWWFAHKSTRTINVQADVVQYWQYDFLMMG